MAKDYVYRLDHTAHKAHREQPPIVDLEKGDTLIVEASSTLTDEYHQAIEAHGDNRVTIKGSLVGFGINSFGSGSTFILRGGDITGLQPLTVFEQAKFVNDGGTIHSTDGLFFNGVGGDTIINSGTIACDGYALYWGGLAKVYNPNTITNTGLIKGEYVLAGDRGSETFRNAGTIDGFVALGGGDDRYDNRQGTATAGSAVGGGDGNDTLLGGVGADAMRGGAGDDRIVGGGGNDILQGDTGHDALTGGTGADTFILAGYGAGTVTRVTDYDPAQDALWLDPDVFKSLAAGALPADAFSNGVPTGTDNTSITYDGQTGKLFYDPDAGGTAHGVALIGILPTGLTLHASDFTVASYADFSKVAFAEAPPP